MEEAKAAAYYDELSRKGEGAARFKQGLGFSTTTSTNRNDVVPTKGSSSFLRSFVKASSTTTTTKTAESDNKQSDLVTIQNKLKKKPPESSRVSREKDRESHFRRRSRSRSRDRHGSRHRRRSSSRDRDRDKDRYVERERGRERRSKSRSGCGSDEDRRRRRDRRSQKNVGIDYGKLIQGYHKMSPAERVKAKMKLQLSETAEKDETKGVGSGWERFEFNKDAPLDDEEIEAAEDDVALVKHIGQSFRFSTVEARREEQIKAAHDKAMFGASSIPPSVNNKDEIEQENNKNESKENAAATSLISDKIIAMQHGSWRDRARKV